MKQRQILLNALSSTVVVVVNAGVLFFLYRFLLHSIGVERLGVWSLVLATTSPVTLANQGFCTSIVKFVAKYVAQEQAASVSRLVQTALLATGLFLGIVVFALYPVGRWILGYLVPPTHLQEATATLPYALFSLWLNLLGNVAQAGLIGHELIMQRNLVVVLGFVSYLLLSLVLVPHLGLLGLAFAQTTQAAMLLLLLWLLLRRQVPSLALVPHQWDRSLFREMFGYGVHFQLITASQALREPITKALLAKFGGLAYTGFYDMAGRWIVTIRELIVQANQVLVPTVSGLAERNPKLLPELYQQSYRVLLFVSLPVFSFLMIVSPAVSQIWIGHYEELFVKFSLLLAAGWLFSTLSNPAYVIYLGTGELRWVTIGCLVTLALNLGIGILLGWIFGGVAVVAASMAALTLGCVMAPIAYHLQQHLPFRLLLPRKNLGSVIVSLAAVVIFVPLFLRSPDTSLLRPAFPAAITLAFAAVVAILMWTNPIRKSLQSRLASELSGLNGARGSVTG